MAFGGGMDRPSIYRTQNSPYRVMDICRLQHCWETIRIGHRGEKAVIRRTHPARARGIGAELARPRATAKGRVCRLDELALEALSRGRETLPVKNRIAVRARAKTMGLEGGLVGIHEGHAVRKRLTTEGAAFAGRQRFDFRKKFFGEQIRYPAQPGAVRIEGGMHVEAVAPARAGCAVRRKREMAVSDEDH